MICAPTAVGNAYAVLSNSEKRARYDKYGLEDDSPSSHRGHRHRYTYHGDDGQLILLNNLINSSILTERKKTNGYFLN
jgi:DnaJ-class molecular chaperone